MSHRYQETDPAGYTSNGILDTDRGTLRLIGVRARWQAGSLPLLMQASAQRSTGSATYDGYLQQGGRLTPFATGIHRSVDRAALVAGLPMTLAEDSTLVPIASFTLQSWKRDLAFYLSRYRHRQFGAGLLCQHSVGALTSEAMILVGRTQHARVAIDVDQWRADLGDDTFYQAIVSLRYRWRAEISLDATVELERFRYGKSAAIGGLLEPASLTRQVSLTLGIARHF